MKKSKPYRELQFENEYVSVWKTTITPDQPLDKKNPSLGRVVVGLKGGKTKLIDGAGRSCHSQFDTHQAYWLDGDESHELCNETPHENESVEVMVIEMKAPQDKPLPSMPID